MKRPAWSGYTQTMFCLAKLTNQVPFLRNEVLSKLREHCSWSLSRRQLSAWLKRKSFKLSFIRPVLLGEDNYELDSKCGNQNKSHIKNEKEPAFQFQWWGITSCYEIPSATKTLNILKFSNSILLHFITILLKISEIKYKIKKSSKTQLLEIISHLFRSDKKAVRCSAKPEKTWRRAVAHLLFSLHRVMTNICAPEIHRKWEGFISKCLFKKT